MMNKFWLHSYMWVIYLLMLQYPNTRILCSPSPASLNTNFIHFYFLLYNSDIIYNYAFTFFLRVSYNSSKVDYSLSLNG